MLPWCVLDGVNRPTARRCTHRDNKGEIRVKAEIRVKVKVGFDLPTCGESFSFASRFAKVRINAAMLGGGDPLASAEGARTQGLGVEIPGGSAVTTAANDAADFSSSLESSSTICIRVNDDGGRSDSVTGFVAVAAVIVEAGIVFSFCSSHALVF